MKKIKKMLKFFLDLQKFMFFRQKVLFNKGIEEANLRVSFF